jgi:hypothetical protein
VISTTLVLALLGFGVLPAPAQEDLDQAIKELATKISKDGLSGRLAEAAAQDWGVQAIREKIDFLVGDRTGRLDRDPQGYYQDLLFTTDPKGDFVLRPEQKEGLSRLASRMKHPAASMVDFNRRADELAKRLGEATDYDTRAKAAWKDPAFRLAFFHRHPAELRQLSTEEIADRLLLRGLVPGPDGKLRIGGPSADELRSRMDQTLGTLDMMKPYEKSYLQEVAKVKDADARTLLASEAGIAVILGRLFRQATEGGSESIGGITEGNEGAGRPPEVSFNLGLDELLPVVAAAQEMASQLAGYFERAAADLSSEAEPEQNLLKFLKNGPARLIMAERALFWKKDQASHAEDIMNSTIEDAFEEKDGNLHVKKGRYVNDQKVDSLEALDSELNNVVEEFNGSMRQDFDRIAERSLDPLVLSVFENREATFLLLEHRDIAVGAAVETVKKQGLDLFKKIYLEKQGETFVVRPERTKRMEAILERAKAIKKENEK